ncbi:MAG: hypothetical protein M0Z42_23375, partial [Actinomycetota bacterium]|nr:hypothetical protein [Actinomycetota bacterium]
DLVLTVPEMDWVVPLLSEWSDEWRPMFDPGAHRALWMTERRGRISVRHLNDAFNAARERAGLAAELDLHSLRHSHVAWRRVRGGGSPVYQTFPCLDDGFVHLGVR